MRLTKYGAPWCAPCNAMDKYAPRVAAEEGVDYEHVDIDAEPHRMPAGAASVPVLTITDASGNEVARHVGAMAPTKLKSWLASFSA